MPILFVAAVWLARFAAGAEVDLHGSARVASKPQAEVVVWLDARGLSRWPTQQHPVLDQRDLHFAPRVLALEVGTTVEFPNHDRVFHNVFSFRDGKRFDLGLYPIGAVKHVVFDKPGVSRIFCNIHPHMAAYVVAVDSSLFTVSGDDGSFTLHGVPEGTYTYHAWRAGAAPLTGTVTTQAGTPLDLEWP